MSITLYTAPDCLRCTIVKGFLADKGIAYTAVDFKADADIFNSFYRANRPRIYRNPEGVEFPLYDDGTVIKQGSGEIIAHILAGSELECCVSRSDLLHGWIAGLYPSRCPDALEGKFVELVRALGKGGLSLCLRVDGRKPALLEQLLTLKPGRVALHLPAAGLQVETADLARSLKLIATAPEHEVNIIITPVSNAEACATPVLWPTREHVRLIAQQLAEAANDKQLPCRLVLGNDAVPEGLEPLTDAHMLKYRSAGREFLFKLESMPVA